MLKPSGRTMRGKGVGKRAWLGVRKEAEQIQFDLLRLASFGKPTLRYEIITPIPFWVSEEY